MVMPNRRDGASSPEWWDDLPPAVKRRVSRPAAPEPPPRAEPEPVSYRPAVLADLSPVAIFFLLTALAIVLFMLLALSFLFDPAAVAD